MTRIFLTLLTVGIAFHSAAQDRPNILWLSIEDISPHLGCYGDPDAITPTVDALAAKGLRYANAFTVAPVCAPNRSAIITGMYQMSIGSHHMRSGGEGENGSKKPKLPDDYKPFPMYLREAGYYATNSSKEDYNFVYDGQIWDASNNDAHWSNRPTKDTPFFAVFNFGDTHEGSVHSNPEAYAKKTARLTAEQRRDPDKIHVPPYHPDTPIVRRQWANVHELITAMDYWVADHLQALEDAGVADNTIVIVWSDHGTGLPRHKRYIYDSGIHVPLIVCVPEKWQKLYKVKPGTVMEDLVSSVDFAPTMLNMLGLDIPAYMQGQPFLGPDRPAPRTYVFGGRDRMDERRDMIRYVRSDRFKLIANYMPEQPYLQYFNTGQQSPVQQELDRLEAAGQLPPGTEWAARDTKPQLEFYDMLNDPNETYNLLNDFGMSVMEFDHFEQYREDMFAALLQWQDQINDLGLIPESELARLEAELGSRLAIMENLNKEHPNFEALMVNMHPFMTGPPLEDYPRESALEQRFASLMDMWSDVLESGPVPLRYRATVALGQVKLPHPLLLKALQDDAAIVRIAAAQALAPHRDFQEPALEVLKTETKSEHEWVRHYAVLALDELGEVARPALPELKAALEDKDNKYVVRVANHAINALEGTNNDVR